MRAFIIALSLLFAASSYATEEEDLLLSSLAANKKGEARAMDGFDVIAALAKKGIFDRKPSTRQDYSDYYFPMKPVQLLGARVVAYQFEYPQRDIGCCVKTGSSVFLLVTGGREKISEFAKVNKCLVSVGDEILFPPKKVVKEAARLGQGQLVELACKDDYLLEDEPPR